MIYAPEKQKKVDERTKIKKEIRELSTLIERGRNRIAELQKQLEKPQGLLFTRHALDRFKQRIQDIPDQTIKKIIKTGGVLEKYLKHGPGRHRLNNYPNVIVTIQDYTVTTVFSAKSPEWKLQHLGQYMEYWIEERCKEEWGQKKPMHFRDFIKNLYK